MATKAELEAKVAELEAKLAATTPDAVVTPADQAESDLIQGLKDQVAGLQANLTQAENSLEAASEEVAARDAEIERLTKELALARDFRDEKEPVIGTTQNVVFLDGQEFPVIHRNTVRELVQDFYKKEVDEEHTAVVIAKTGG